MVQMEGKRDAQAAAPEPASKKQRADVDANHDDERCTAATEIKSPDCEALAPTDCSNFRDYGNEGKRTEWESVVQQ